MSSRSNIPFFIAGAIACLTLITSVVPALNIAPPVIFILFALSAVVIVFSYKMIKQSKKSQENSKAEVKELNKESSKEELENEEAKENKKKISDLEKKIERISDGFVTKDKVEGLEKVVSDLSAKLINSTAIDEVEEKLSMEFYAKGEERGWNTTLSDIILSNDIKEKLKGICELQGRGYLLYGPPGTGKTSISKAIANQTKSLFAFIYVSVSCLSHQSNIDRVFEKAEANSPCIIFIDEIDGIGKKRTSIENAGPLIHLLTKLDREFLSSKNITVIAATNHKDHLDPALIRGGRLECIEVPGLDKDDTRQKILQERLGKLKDSDVKILVQASKGFAMANLICLINKINETTEESEIRYFRTFCKNFKKEHNIKDERDKKHSKGKTKNEDISLSSGRLSRSSSVSLSRSSSASLSRSSSASLSRSSSVSSSLSDVSSLGEVRRKSRNKENTPL